MEVVSLGVQLWSPSPPPPPPPPPTPPPSGRVVPELCVVADGGLVRSPLSESPPLQPAEALSAAQHPVSLVLLRKREREERKKKGGPSVSCEEWHRGSLCQLRKAALLRTCSVCLQLVPSLQNGC